MIKHLAPTYKNNRWLIIALLISLALHSLILKQFSWVTPLPKTSSDHLTIKLTTSSTNTKQTSVPKDGDSSQSEFKSQVTETPLDSKPTDLDTSTVAIDNTKKPIEQKESLSNDEAYPINMSEVIPNQVINLESEGVSQSSDLGVLQEKNQTSSITDKPTPPTYQYAELEYVVLNSNSETIGSSSIKFTLDKNNTYILEELTRYIGASSSKSHTITQRSHGIIDEHGLTPGYYALSNSIDPKANISASFAWSDGFISIAQSNMNKQLALVEGAQDILSARFQLMFDSYSTSMPTLYDSEYTYLNYKLIGFETLNTHMGDLKSIHLQAEVKNLKIEVWLAIDYQNIPVKYLKIDHLGTINEQLIIKSIGTINQ